VARDFVPTAITRGPDGAYYFGHLNGTPPAVGTSKIYRMERGGTPEVFLENFTWIVALAFDPSGNLYVLQFTDGTPGNANGLLIRVAPDGTREKVIAGLQRSTGLAIDSEGAVYLSMTNGTNYTGPGEVRRYVIP
jgi:sugar lactone lactonase YvrE